MKYKVGDKVRVRKDLVEQRDYFMEDGSRSDVVIKEMLDACGKVATISRAGYKYSLEEYPCCWTDEMFEDLVSTCVTKVIYNPPATIVWFDDGDKIVSKAEDEFDWETGLAICVLKKRMERKGYNRLQPYFFEGDRPLWDVLVRMECPNGEWEKIKKKWRQK